MITSHHRGHPIYLDGEIWKYTSDNMPINKEDRPCLHCGRPATPEGHDACLGYVKGVQSACCGHGLRPGYLIKTNGRWVLLPKRK